MQSKIGAQRDDPSEEAVAAILQFRAAGYPQKKKKQKNTQKTHKTTSFPAFIDQGIQKKKERLPILRPIRRQRRYKSAPLQIRDHYSSADFIMIFFCRGDSFSVPSPKKSVLYFLFLAIFIATWMARKETWATAEQEKAEKKNQRKIKRAHRKKKNKHRKRLPIGGACSFAGQFSLSCDFSPYGPDGRQVTNVPVPHVQGLVGVAHYFHPFLFD